MHEFGTRAWAILARGGIWSNCGAAAATGKTADLVGFGRSELGQLDLTHTTQVVQQSINVELGLVYV